MDILVGCVFGVLGSSNLVQGAWTEFLPWLNLTAVAFLAAPLIALTAVGRRLPIVGILAVLALLGALCLGFVQSPDGAAADEKRWNVIAGVVMVALAGLFGLANERRLKGFLGTVVVLGLVAAGGQWLIPDGAALLTGRRTPEGLNAIGVGRLLGAGLTIVLVFGLKVRRPHPSLLLALPLAAALVAAGSRGPLLGTAAAIGLVVLLHPALRPPARLGILVLATPFSYVVYNQWIDSGSRLADVSGTGRARLYEVGVRIALEHPAGVGWGNFYRHVPPGLLVSEQGQNLYVHNIVLEFLTETGVVGALLFAVFLVCVAGCAITRARTVLSIAMAALALNLFVGALLSSDVVGNRMLWVVCAGILGGALPSSQRVLVRGRAPGPKRPTAG